MRVQDLIKMKGDSVIAVMESVLMKNAVGVMHDHAVGAVVVITEAGHLKGVFSEREIVVALAEQGKAALERPIAEFMHAGRPSVALTDSVRDVMAIMTERRVRHLPVLRDGLVVGLISLGDTVKARLAEKIAENEVLQDIARWPAPSLA